MIVWIDTYMSPKTRRDRYTATVASMLSEMKKQEHFMRAKLYQVTGRQRRLKSNLGKAKRTIYVAKSEPIVKRQCVLRR